MGRPITTQDSLPAAGQLCRAGLPTRWVPSQGFSYRILLAQASPGANAVVLESPDRHEPSHDAARIDRAEIGGERGQAGEVVVRGVGLGLEGERPGEEVAELDADAQIE